MEDQLLPGDLPEIDLYLDQVTTLLERRLPGYAERPLTKAMINNYSREKLIRGVSGKKYTRDQILQLVIVYHLKQALGMQEIRGLFDFLDAAGIGYAQCYLALLDARAAANGEMAEPAVRDGTDGASALLSGFLLNAMRSMRFRNEADACLAKMAAMAGNI